MFVKLQATDVIPICASNTYSIAAARQTHCSCGCWCL